nr:hypothetical protein CFP56_33366 [Quercus suber]
MIFGKLISRYSSAFKTTQALQPQDQGPERLVRMCTAPDSCRDASLLFCSYQEGMCCLFYIMYPNVVLLKDITRLTWWMDEMFRLEECLTLKC